MNIPLNIDWQQILLHLFNFAILAGGLYLLLYRPVKQFIEQREEHYKCMRDEAEQAKTQAEQLRDEYQLKLSEADTDISRRRTEAEAELEKLRDEQTREAKREAGDILKKAREDAENERAKLLTKASRELVDAAVSAAEKLAVGENTDPYEQFLELAERRGSDEQSG